MLSSVSEAVDDAVLAAERVDDIEGHHGLALRVSGVADSVVDHIAQPDKENSAAHRAGQLCVSCGAGGLRVEVGSCGQAHRVSS